MILYYQGISRSLVVFSPYALTTNPPFDNLLLSSSAIIPQITPTTHCIILSLDITCTLQTLRPTSTCNYLFISYYRYIFHIYYSIFTTYYHYTTNTPPYYPIAMFNHILHYHTTSTTHELPKNYPRTTHKTTL